MEKKDMQKLPKEMLETVNGGTPEDARAYWEELQAKYETTDTVELLQQITHDEFAMYQALYYWEH